MGQNPKQNKCPSEFKFQPNFIFELTFSLKSHSKGEIIKALNFTQQPFKLIYLHFGPCLILRRYTGMYFKTGTGCTYNQKFALITLNLKEITKESLSVQTVTGNSYRAGNSYDSTLIEAHWYKHSKRSIVKKINF